MKVVVVRALLQFREHARRAFVRPVREHDDVFAVVLEGFGLSSLNHERPIQSQLFLESRMTVVPVRARLPHLEAIHVRLARTNAMEAETWHAVHIRGQQDAVPVNRRVLVERIRHAQSDRVTFFPAERRRWHRPVHGERHSRVPREVHGRLTDAQVELGSRERAVQATGGLPCANAGVRHKPRPAAAPPTARPLTKVRRETCPSKNAGEENRCELIDPQS